MEPFVNIARLSACCLNISKSLYALVGYSLPVLSGNDILREELRAHTNAKDTTLDPLGEILLVWRNGAGNHDV